MGGVMADSASKQPANLARVVKQQAPEHQFNVGSLSTAAAALLGGSDPANRAAAFGRALRDVGGLADNALSQVAPATKDALQNLLLNTPGHAPAPLTPDTTSDWNSFAATHLKN